MSVKLLLAVAGRSGANLKIPKISIISALRSFKYDLLKV